MTPGMVMEIGRQAIEVTLLIAAPMLLTALIVGLIVSIFQAATQLNESHCSLYPNWSQCSSYCFWQAPGCFNI
jgi:flagellar biosynthetic protein FliQ